MSKTKEKKDEKKKMIEEFQKFAMNKTPADWKKDRKTTSPPKEEMEELFAQKEDPETLRKKLESGEYKITPFTKSFTRLLYMNGKGILSEDEYNETMKVIEDFKHKESTKKDLVEQTILDGLAKVYDETKEQRKKREKVLKTMWEKREKDLI
jgi:predicted ATPase